MTQKNWEYLPYFILWFYAHSFTIDKLNYLYICFVISFCLQGVVERLGQVQPKLMITVNAVVYNGKVHDHMGKLTQVIQGTQYN